MRPMFITPFEHTWGGWQGELTESSALLESHLFVGRRLCICLVGWCVCGRGQSCSLYAASQLVCVVEMKTAASQLVCVVKVKTAASQLVCVVEVKAAASQLVCVVEVKTASSQLVCVVEVKAAASQLVCFTFKCTEDVKTVMRLQGREAW